MTAGSAETPTEAVRLYSALGEPLFAEIPLQNSEPVDAQFKIEGGGGEWVLLPNRVRNTLLLLSKSTVDTPIVELNLSTDNQSRSLTLLLGPEAPLSREAYLREMVEAQTRLLEQNRTLLSQQQRETRAQGRVTHSIVDGEIFSRWALFLLLGGLIALLITIRWWRSAEPMELESPTDGDSWGSFQRGVAQIEGQVQRPVAEEVRG